MQSLLDARRQGLHEMCVSLSGDTRIYEQNRLAHFWAAQNQDMANRRDVSQHVAYLLCVDYALRGLAVAGHLFSAGERLC